MSNKSYEALCKSQNEGLSWFCVHCRISFSGVTKMTNKINQLEQTQKEIVVTVKELKEKDSDSDKQISRQEIEDLVREEVKEQKRIDERKLNTMCFGLEESNQSSVENRRSDDEDRLLGIMKEVMGDEDLGINNTIRIVRQVTNVMEDVNFEQSRVGLPPGQNNEGNAENATSQNKTNEASELGRNSSQNNGSIRRARPIRVTFTDIAKKKTVLDTLRDTVNVSKRGRYQYIFFQKDLTWKQREIAKAKRALRAEMRESDSERRVQGAQRSSQERVFRRQ